MKQWETRPTIYSSWCVNIKLDKTIIYTNYKVMKLVFNLILLYVKKNIIFFVGLPVHLSPTLV